MTRDEQQAAIARVLVTVLHRRAPDLPIAVADRMAADVALLALGVLDAMSLAVRSGEISLRLTVDPGTVE